MKYIISLIIAALLVTGAWYGLGTYRRKQMLASGRSLLLVNTKAGVYTYSDLMESDDITSAFKIIGYADELSSEQIAQATANYQLVVGVAAQPGDPRVIQSGGGAPFIPSTAQQKSWSTALAALPKTQQDLCAKTAEPAYTQACLAEHLMWSYVKTGVSVASCDVFYVPVQKETCIARVGKKDNAAFSDANNNQLIDGFEQLAIPPQERTNTYNLPVINPSE